MTPAKHRHVISSIMHARTLTLTATAINMPPAMPVFIASQPHGTLSGANADHSEPPSAETTPTPGGGVCVCVCVLVICIPNANVAKPRRHYSQRKPRRPANTRTNSHTNRQLMADRLITLWPFYEPKPVSTPPVQFNYSVETETLSHAVLHSHLDAFATSCGQWDSTLQAL